MGWTSNIEHWDNGVEPAHQDLPHDTIADLSGATDAAETQAGSLNGVFTAVEVKMHYAESLPVYLLQGQATFL
jgi:hypothetical protein